MAASATPRNAIPAPRISYDRPSDWWETISNIASGDVDLRQRKFGGNHAAQRVRLVNDTAANLVAVLLQELPEGVTATGQEQSITVLANSQYDVDRPIRKIIASGSGALKADVFWWFSAGSMPNP